MAGVCTGSSVVLPVSVDEERGQQGCSQAECVPGIGDQVCCSAWTPQGAVSGLQSQCPGLHSTIRAVLPREPRGLSLSLPSWESFSSFPN